MKSLIFTVVLLCLVVMLNAQETEKKSKKQIKAEKKEAQIKETKAAIDAKAFVFEATSANPMKGNVINLTSFYDIMVTNDSVFSHMPYFGVAYTASIGSSDSPMSFAQPVKTYTMEPEKSGYLVKIKINNQSDRIDLTFHIGDTGSTSLTAISPNRQTINYYGNVVGIKKNK